MSNVENVQPALLNAFLLTTKDALMVLEAANRGICPVVSRRLHDSEKASMVKSGSVFAFDEQTTGIKRCECRVVHVCSCRFRYLSLMNCQISKI